ncbi:MAG: Fic family protein [Oligoflexia bacterium]|nr:Fic family protein [Oligoflexia bacterium]
MKYIWEKHDWPEFRVDTSKIQGVLYQYALETGALSGGLAQLPEEIQQEAMIDTMVVEALKTSIIEGESFNPEDVRSSILNQLGFTLSSTSIKDPRSIGIAQLMISVRESFNSDIDEQQLFSWHKMIMITSSRITDLEVGKWRTGQAPMQIVSGPIGNEKIHFEAPPSKSIPLEMKRFIKWFNETHPTRGTVKMQGPVRAAIAHLYFETIHPFSDGNGRIGRALSEKALSQDLQRPALLSLSVAINKNRKQYYQSLSHASLGDMDITPWIIYFVNTTYAAQLMAKKRINFIFQKVRFWNKYESQINERQKKVLKRLFQAGVDGFEGGISSQKYMRIAGCSKATATRDLSDLLKKGCINTLPGGGRSTQYELAIGTIVGQEHLPRVGEEVPLFVSKIKKEKD